MHPFLFSSENKDLIKCSPQLLLANSFTLSITDISLSKSNEVHYPDHSHASEGLVKFLAMSPSSFPSSLLSIIMIFQHQGEDRCDTAAAAAATALFFLLRRWGWQSVFGHDCLVWALRKIHRAMRRGDEKSYPENKFSVRMWSQFSPTLWRRDYKAKKQPSLHTDTLSMTTVFLELQPTSF